MEKKSLLAVWSALVAIEHILANMPETEQGPMGELQHELQKIEATLNEDDS